MLSGVRVQDLAKWCGGELKGPADVKVGPLSTDSRTLAKGDVFLAIRGPNFDGHAYIAEAIERGAAIVIAESQLPEGGSVPTIKVKDSVKALIAIAQTLRNRFKGNVVAVTGSAGKSSTKDAIATLLGENTVKSPASFNNLLGVSRTVWTLEDSTKNLVLEMGMNALGEIKELCETFRPEIGLITNIGDAHIGKVGGPEGVYRAKKEMFDFLSSQGRATKGLALNVDDPRVEKAYHACFPKGCKEVKTYSTAGRDAAIQVLDKSLDEETGFLNLALSIEGVPFRWALPVFGSHHAQNIAAAVAVARLLGISANKIESRVGQVVPAPHRGEIKALSQERILIDESYNSNPSALTSSLEALASLSLARRRILVLGEMRELGEYSESLHRQVGEKLVELYQEKRFPFIVIGVGPMTLHTIEPVKRQLPHIPWFHVENHKEALSKIELLGKPKDIFFIKGSRGIQLDHVVKALAK